MLPTCEAGQVRASLAINIRVVDKPCGISVTMQYVSAGRANLFFYSAENTLFLMTVERSTICTTLA